MLDYSKNIYICGYFDSDDNSFTCIVTGIQDKYVEILGREKGGTEVRW